MSHPNAITDRVMTAMLPGGIYYYRDLRELDGLRDIKDKQLRNALVGLQVNGRLLKTGTHCHYRYYLNPVQPPLRADAARATASVLHEARHPPTTSAPALAAAPVWPAPPRSPRFDREPVARIAA